jgi:hypothetical protein
MSACGKCNKIVTSSTKYKLQCSICQVFFHGNCANISESDIDIFNKNPYKCDDCVNKIRLQRGASDSTPVKTDKQSKDSLLITSDVCSVKMFKEMFEQLESKILNGQRKLEDDLGKSLESCHEKLDEYRDILNRQIELTKKQNDIIESLQTENKCLKAKVTDLTIKLEDLQQYSRANTVEIHGVPVSANEDTLQKTIEVGRALNMVIMKDMIDICHRLPVPRNKNTSDRVPGIIVRFVRRYDKEELLQKRKIKRNLTCASLGLQSNSPIYVNQSLAPGRRTLFNMAKKFQKDSGCKYLWIDRASNIKLRMRDKSAVHIIACEDDLNKLVKSAATNRIKETDLVPQNEPSL